MIDSATINTITQGIIDGSVIPYLGAGVLRGVTNLADGTHIPADGESLILAMNNGTPMAPKLMYEFPRAAMNLEQKKGRKFIERFLTTTYGEKQWSESVVHRWLADLKLPYIIDCNRDTQLQILYKERPHVLVIGLARISGTDYRFKLYENTNGVYREISLSEVNKDLPVLFKPMGSPTPEPNYIASDADYVDYITELMGGFAIPAFLKEYRMNKKYVFLGMRMTRDTERMVLSDIIYAAQEPAGWAFIPNASDKEKRFCEKKGLEIINADWDQLLQELKAA